jgi:hypothetical protein
MNYTHLIQMNVINIKFYSSEGFQSGVYVKNHAHPYFGLDIINFLNRQFLFYNKVVNYIFVNR